MKPQPAKPDPNKDDNPWMVVGKYLGLLTALPATIFVAYEIGDWLDKQFSTSFLKIVFVLLGTVAGFLPIFYDLTRND